MGSDAFREGRVVDLFSKRGSMSPDISAIANLAVRVVGLVPAIISLMTAVLNRRKKEPVQLPKEKKQNTR